MKGVPIACFVFFGCLAITGNACGQNSIPQNDSYRVLSFTNITRINKPVDQVSEKIFAYLLCGIAGVEKKSGNNGFGYYGGMCANDYFENGNGFYSLSFEAGPYRNLVEGILSLRVFARFGTEVGFETNRTNRAIEKNTGLRAGVFLSTALQTTLRIGRTEFGGEAVWREGTLIKEGRIALVFKIKNKSPQ